MKNNCFNPLESAFFKQAQLASVLASDVSGFWGGEHFTTFSVLNAIGNSSVCI